MSKKLAGEIVGTVVTAYVLNAVLNQICSDVDTGITVVKEVKEVGFKNYCLGKIQGGLNSVASGANALAAKLNQK